MSNRTITLHKGSHKYVFRYSPGNERDIYTQIIRLAEDGGCNLDWADAAMLSAQVADGVIEVAATAYERAA